MRRRLLSIQMTDDELRKALCFYMREIGGVPESNVARLAEQIGETTGEIRLYRRTDPDTIVCEFTWDDDEISEERNFPYHGAGTVRGQHFVIPEPF